MLFDADADVRLRAAHEAGEDWRPYLSTIPELCVWCHMDQVLQDCIAERNKRDERERKRRNMADELHRRELQQGTYRPVRPADVPILAAAAADDDEETDENVVIVNRYMVHVGEPGEYREDALIQDDRIGPALWGPFVELGKCGSTLAFCARLRARAKLDDSNYTAVDRMPDGPPGVPGMVENPRMLFQ